MYKCLNKRLLRKKPRSPLLTNLYLTLADHKGSVSKRPEESQEKKKVEKQKRTAVDGKRPKGEGIAKDFLLGANLFPACRTGWCNAWILG